MAGQPLIRVIADAAGPRLAEFNELWIGSILWSIASCPVNDAEEDAERKRYLVALSRAPVLHPLGQWKGHKLCLLANALFQVQDEVPEMWHQVKTCWTQELLALAELLRCAALEAADPQRYRLRIQATELFHVGPFYTRQLLELLQIKEASHEFVTSARLHLQEREASRGVACFASFDVMVNGSQVVKEGLFLTSPASDACGDQLPLVSVPLNHDRSGHAELKAMQWLLQNLREASVPAGKSLREVSGHMSLHVTHHPCLSCLGAFAQLQGILPQLQLYVSFDWTPGAARGA